MVEQILIRGDFKKMSIKEKKYIIIYQTENSLTVDFMTNSNDKDLLAQVGCSENSFDYEDLEQFEDYIKSFKKPYDKITIEEFIKSINDSNTKIKYIIEVNSERTIYKNKN